MSNPRAETIAAIYKAAINSTRAEAEKVPEDKRMQQSGEGKAHATWQLGHIAQLQDLIVNQWLLGGTSVLPDDYGPRFNPAILGGEIPTPLASDYPTWDNIVNNYNAACTMTLELISELDDDELAGKVKGDVPEQAKSFFSDLSPSLISMALHITHHRGQIGIINASLG